MQPRHTDRIALLEICHARPERRDDAGNFVAWNERRRRLHGPITIRGVEVRMADTAGNDLDEKLSRLFLDLGRLHDLTPTVS
jgi:hypothetical protein